MVSSVPSWIDSDGVESSVSKDKQEDKSTESVSKTYEPAFVDVVLVRLHQAVTATFLLDLGLIIYQVYLSHAYLFKSSAMSKIFAWIAFTLNWGILQSDACNGGTRSRWVSHILGWIALVGYSFLTTPLFVYAWKLISSGVLLENNTKIDPLQLLNTAIDIVEKIQLSISVIRYALLWLIVLVSVLHLTKALDMNSLKVPETLFQDLGTGKSEEEVTITNSQKERLKEMDEEEKAESEAFKNFWPKIKLAIRLSYPWGERRLQFLIAVKFVLVLVDRAVNLLVPIQTERIIRGFTQGSDGELKVSNFLSIIQRLAWEPVNEYSETSITLRFFEHVHNMSMKFHMDRKSGELMQIMSRGVNAMQSVSTTFLFRLFPTVADVIIAVVYFWVAWGWKYGLIVTVNSTLYLVISAYTTKRRSQYYREWIVLDDGSHGKAMDSLMNFETVKYFTAEKFEVSQYRKGFEKTRGKSFELSVAYELLDMFETLVWTVNSLAGCMLCAYEISTGARNVGSFMSYVVYTRQLETPVDHMAWYFKSLRSNFVSMEKILKLLEEEPTVKDIPDAKPLVISDGEIVFDNVSFQYDENKKGLSNISFTVPKGKTVALVGPTGSGKSTILRLVFRLWDPTSGRILIDGQNIAETTQRSVREQIGVVPQESVLFDDSIAFNIHYGRVTASKEDIENAAKAAQIHESILKFKDGYESTVGERGTKLSGGEKQRIALARTILKNPRIVLLDEATSALDSATESQIQMSLAKMTENRTTLVVAHRLSTIKNADIILCLRDGEIVERGSHAELIQRALDNGGEGEYYKMWQLQLGETTKSDKVGDENADNDDNKEDGTSLEDVKEAPKKEDPEKEAPKKEDPEKEAPEMEKMETETKSAFIGDDASKTKVETVNVSLLAASMTNTTSVIAAFA
ncbi:ATP-binding cassette sub- B member 6, mitochondrial [Dissophora globulifera]|nr:ATP-binding cassette sub- B member 6, mitochondrial [Dissophora globulifera]